MRKTPKPIEDIVTVPQAARLKGVTRQAVYDAIETEKITATRVGRTWLIRVKELDQWQVWGHRPLKGIRRSA